MTFLGHDVTVPKLWVQESWSGEYIITRTDIGSLLMGHHALETLQPSISLHGRSLGSGWILVQGLFQTSSVRLEPPAQWPSWFPSIKILLSGTKIRQI
jgi:hypothetical protein